MELNGCWSLETQKENINIIYWHHTLTQNLKAQVYGSTPHLYGTQLFHFYSMWDFTSHLYSNNFLFKCESLPHDSLPLERKSLSSTSISWWLLEFTYSRYLHHCSTHGTRHLDPPSRKLSIQGIFRPRIHYCHLTRLSWSPSRTIDSNTNCWVSEEGKYRGDLHQ